MHTQTILRIYHVCFHLHKRALLSWHSRPKMSVFITFCRNQGSWGEILHSTQLDHSTYHILITEASSVTNITGNLTNQIWKILHMQVLSTISHRATLTCWPWQGSLKSDNTFLQKSHLQMDAGQTILVLRSNQHLPTGLSSGWIRAAHGP